jgi:hypothetical protein
VLNKFNYKTRKYEDISILNLNFSDHGFGLLDTKKHKELKDGILGKRPEVDYFINNNSFNSTTYYYSRNKVNPVYTPMPLSKMQFGRHRRKDYLENIDIFLNCATKATTEDEVLELINNNSNITKEIFEKIEEKFQIIPLVKSKDGRKIIEKNIYKIKSSILLQKMIKEYNIDIKTSLSKAITSKLPDVIYPLLFSLSKAQKNEYFSKIIRILPDLLVKPDFPIELINELESIDTIRWECYGPEPGVFTDYYLKYNFKEYLLTKGANSDILEYIFEKIKPEINNSDLRKYLLLTLKTNNITEDFYTTMGIFKKYSKPVEPEDSSD